MNLLYSATNCNCLFSDSGLGIGGGKNGSRDEADRVYVVEMGNSVGSANSGSFK